MFITRYFLILLTRLTNITFIVEEMDTSHKISENLEDYLETISALEALHGVARPTDIASALNVKKPSVTSALNILSEKGLVVYEKYRPVSLTPEGKILADSISKKHKLLCGFFTDILGVDSHSADIAACKMEHALDDDIMRRLVDFLEDIKKTQSSKK